jgi:hypothetical protein
LNINLTNSESIFIYGKFINEIKNLESIKNASNSPLSKSDINKDLKLYSSITKKLEEANPNLKKLKSL